MKKLLITGFDPFNGGQVNPSWETAAALPDRVGEYELKKIQLPVIYGEAADLVLAEAKKWQPDVILCLGLAGGRGNVTPERIGINLRSASIADNAGNRYADMPIDADGPAAYFSTLPVTAMAQAIRDADLPGAVSNTAGTYVCNDVLYTLLRHFDGTKTRIGFIHVPYLPGQGEPNMSLDDMVRALIAAISAI